MRLGYLVPEFPAQTHAFFWREVRALREAGHEVFLVSTRRPEPDACKHEFAAEARKQTTYLFPPQVAIAIGLARHIGSAPKIFSYLAELENHSLKARARSSALVLVALQLALFAQQNALDHIHIHSCADAAHLGAMAFLLGGPNYSLTLHGDLDVYGTDHSLKFRHAKFVSVVTCALREQVKERLGYDQARLPVIRMGVDTLQFSPTISKPIGNAFRALTIARLNHTKGHLYALEAIAALRKGGHIVHYDIAGSGPEEAAIMAHIKRLKLEDLVVMHGSVSEVRVQKLLAEADVFLLTSFGQGEAAPVSVMEAMAAGVPVVCSLIGGTGEMIEDGVEGFLVDQQDSGVIERTLVRILESPELRAQVVSKARSRAERDFDYRKNALKLATGIMG